MNFHQNPILISCFVCHFLLFTVDNFYNLTFITSYGLITHSYGLISLIALNVMLISNLHVLLLATAISFTYFLAGNLDLDYNNIYIFLSLLVMVMFHFAEWFGLITPNHYRA